MQKTYGALGRKSKGFVATGGALLTSNGALLTNIGALLGNIAALFPLHRLVLTKIGGFRLRASDPGIGGLLSGLKVQIDQPCAETQSIGLAARSGRCNSFAPVTMERTAKRPHKVCPQIGL